jgi:TonB family protein
MRTFVFSLFTVALSATLSCSSGGEADAPPGAVSVHVEGDVQVDSGGGFVKLEPKVELTPAHVVKTGPSSFVLLHLSNGHLVKLDADLQIRVGDIAQLKEDRTETALAQQLDFLMNAEERAKLPSAEVLAERVAGFQHRKRAGRTVGAQTAPAPSAAVAPEAQGELAEAEADLEAPGSPADAEEPMERAKEAKPAVAKAENREVAPTKRKKKARAAKKDSSRRFALKNEPIAPPAPPPPPSSSAPTKSAFGATTADEDAADEGGAPGGLSGVGTISRGGGTASGSGGLKLGKGASKSLRKKSASPKVRLGGAKPTVEGALDPDVVRRIVRKNTAQVKRCYEGALKRNPKLAGKLVIAWVIGANGRVTKASVVENSTESEKLGKCVTSRVRRWRFPKPDGGGVVNVKFPFVFKNG